MRGDAKNLIGVARSKSCAVPAFNVDSVEMAMGVIEAAEQTDTGIILQVTAATLTIWGWEFALNTFNWLIDRVQIPITLMLDHATTFDDIKRAMDLGITAVMFDGSAMPLEDNIRLTKMVTAYAQQKGNCFVEGEVGHVARDGEPPEWEHLTSVKEAKAYWDATHVDALAVAVGSKHGHYRNVGDINVTRVGEISRTVDVPLVLHGGSGMPPELFPELLANGIAKVNVGTELRRVWWDAVALSRAEKPREALKRARHQIVLRSVEIIHRLNTVSAEKCPPAGK